MALNLYGQLLSAETLFTIKGAMLATKSPDAWQEVRDQMLHDINRRNYFA